MKQFSTIFKFEFKELIKTKAYIVTTLILCLGALVGLCFPLIFGSMDSPTDTLMNKFQEETTFAIYDEKNIVEKASIKLVFPNAEIIKTSSTKEVKELLNNKKAEAGFVIESDLAFKYFVYNSDTMDTKAMVFSEMMEMNYKNKQLVALGLEGKEAFAVSNAKTTYTSEVLGSDGANNMIYTFILLFVIYMVIIMYGNIIATSVASEKGNRTMELLATTANPTSLIFGKVLSGCLAASLQLALIIGSVCLGYALAGDAWNGMLDIVFNIPADVLIAFAVFGILGFVFYAFIFGALGALVSKSEDVNSSSTPIQLIFVVVYFVAYIGILNPDSPVLAIASYIPFTSSMVMFARMAMVEVPMIEVVISLVILVVSTVLVGLGASKIYRRATLMYGNQIKISHAFKWLNKKN